MGLIILLTIPQSFSVICPHEVCLAVLLPQYRRLSGGWGKALYLVAVVLVRGVTEEDPRPHGKMKVDSVFVHGRKSAPRCRGVLKAGTVPCATCSTEGPGGQLLGAMGCLCLSQLGLL